MTFHTIRIDGDRNIINEENDDKTIMNLISSNYIVNNSELASLLTSSMTYDLVPNKNRPEAKDEIDVDEYENFSVVHNRQFTEDEINEAKQFTLDCIMKNIPVEGKDILEISRTTSEPLMTQNVVQIPTIDISSIAKQFFDVIILQRELLYINDSHEFFKTMEAAISKTKEDGTSYIFVGDVRDKELTPVYQRYVRYFQPEKTDENDCNRSFDILSSTSTYHKDLFKIFLKEKYPCIVDVQVFNKPAGKFDTEISFFRYDVILTINHDNEYS